MKKIIYALTFIIIILALGLYNYYIRNIKKIDSRNEINSSQSLNSLDSVLYNKVEINPLSRIAEIRQDISDDQNPSQLDKSIKLTNYYQTLLFSVPNGINSQKRDVTVQSYNGLNEIYISGRVSKDVASQRSVVLLYNSYRSSCFIPSWLAESEWIKDQDYIKVSGKYKNINLANLLFLDLKLKELQQSTNDKLVSGQRILNLSMILNSYNREISKEDKDVYITELKSLTDSHKSLKATQFYTISYFKELFPLTAYVIGVETYGKFSKLSLDEKSNLKDDYEVMYKLSKNYFDTGKTDIFGKYFSTTAYAQYLINIDSRKYAKSIDFLYNELSGEVKKVKENNPEKLHSLNMYVRASYDVNGNWDYFRINDIKNSKNIESLKFLLENFK